MGAMGAQQSVFSQLRVLRRELSGFAGSSIDTLRELIETFPDGWARRRALSALLETGIPAGNPKDALELVSCLDRELDRRWCLGLLARKGDLRGAILRSGPRSGGLRLFEATIGGDRGLDRLFLAPCILSSSWKRGSSRIGSQAGSSSRVATEIHPGVVIAVWIVLTARYGSSTHA